jgi:hypothetical protein
MAYVTKRANSTVSIISQHHTSHDADDADGTDDDDMLTLFPLQYTSSIIVIS